MKNVLKSLVLICLAVVVALPLSAQDDDKKKKRKKGNRAAAFASVVKQIDAKVDLTDEQSAKIKKLQEEVTPKLAAVVKVIGKKQREINAAAKKLVEGGKKRKDATAEAEAAAGLTDEQKAAIAKRKEIQVGFRKAVTELLTPEQQKKLAPKRGNKKKKGKKKKDA
jgi:Spy/CpxP family protein refolding chaperone